MPDLPAYNSNALLTRARRAVWDAIDNWQPLIDLAANMDVPIFKHRMEDDLNEILSEDSSFFELPSITVMPGAASEAWEVHRMAKFADQFVLDIKTAFLDQAEEISEMVWQAIWQSAPALTPTVSYIRAATGRYPVSVTINRQVANVGKQKAWLFRMSFTLNETQDVLSTILAARVAS